MIVNCTPHQINIRPEGLPEVVVPPSGVVPRVSVEQKIIAIIEGIPVVSTQYGAVEGLPDPVEGTVYIVSALVLSALVGSRPDCVAPDTSPTSAVRNENGQIVAVRRFTR